RLCMSSAVVAYQQALGVDAPPCCYDDIEAARTFLIVGANIEACHPILFNRIRARKRADRDVRIVVVDPRRTRTAEIADLHLPVRPGADVPLLMSLLYEVSRAGGLDEGFIADHTTGWPAVREALRAYQAELAEDAAGVPAEAILEAARLLAAGGPVLTLWTMGANQSSSGVQNNLALINLSLATGNIGKPGAGPFSLTGQPNAMGGREAGGLAGSLPGHRSVADPVDREEVEQAWGLPSGAISDRPGLTAVEMVEALEAGAIKVVWIAGSNPLASLPNTMRVQRAFSRAELVVVQDAYHPTETTRIANVLLPAAQWSERSGTMTNSERRICLLEQVGDPPGEALPDWEIFCRVAHRLGYRDAFDYEGPEAIFEEYRALTRGRDLDITGVTYELLATRPGGVQWPYPAGAESGTQRLYTDGRFATPDGRARFLVPEHHPPADTVDLEYPLALITGRVKDQWHTMTRTGRVKKLLRSEPQPFVEIHPTDAARYSVREGDVVRVTSRRSSVELRARITEAIRPGAVFAPFHWGALHGRNTAANRATSEALDPQSKQPELKFAAVRLAVIESASLRAGAVPAAGQAT
ncbi:MAG: molybdopterin-dependent oxidoreductase, partial [Dehalococcoidia bacterium]